MRRLRVCGGSLKAEIQRVRAWLAEVLPARPQGYFLGPFVAHHFDDLVTDMGVPRRRTRNVFSEYLAGSHPRDIATSPTNSARL